METVGQGFFVEKQKDKDYPGPFASLKEARGEARKIGPGLNIFHGILKKDSGTLNTSELYLVPKAQKH